MFIVTDKYTHSTEVEKRLNFIKVIASNSAFKITKEELKELFDLVSASPVASDSTDFLNWAKKCCEEQTPEKEILDLNQFGDFLIELIEGNSLKLETLPLGGFQLIEMFFLSSNINEKRIKKLES